MEELEYFKCPDCGCRNLVYQRFYTLVENFEEFIPCECDDSEDGIAYERSYSRSSNRAECNWLGDDHKLDERAEDFEDVEYWIKRLITHPKRKRA